MRKDAFKIFLFLWLVGSLGASLLHFFFPEIISNSSSWSASPGWQREIALWNVGIMLAILYAFMKGEEKFIRFMVMVLMFISFFLGTHHAVALLTQASSVHLLGFILNYIAIFFGLVIFRKRVK